MKSRKKLKSKKDKPVYDEDGKWVDQDSRVLSGIRRAYRLSPQMQETLKAARVELPPLPLKNGKAGKRVRVRYRCAICDGLFMQKNVQVDHIDPATPIGLTIREMSWDNVVDGIFCGAENLQVICSTPKIKNGGLPSCHAKKSAEENWIRKALAKRYPDGELKERWECGLVGSVDTGEGDIDIYKLKYKEYLIEKDVIAEAKAQRKIDREAKREAKRLEREQKMRDKIELKEAYELAKKHPRKKK